jgi:hypothetical protein
MISLTNPTSFKSPIKTVTSSENYNAIRSSSKGESCEYKQVESEIKYQDRTQVMHILESAKDIAEFERRAEHLRDLLLENRTALSEQEMLLLKRVFNSNKQLIDSNQEIAQLILVSLASLLEPLIENDAYSQDIKVIVISLLKSLSISLRYAGLDIIAAGLGIVPIADSLLEEAKVLLKNEKPGYVLDYLESF